MFSALHANFLCGNSIFFKHLSSHFAYSVEQHKENNTKYWIESVEQDEKKYAVS
jgi:hypothetical protein